MKAIYTFTLLFLLQSVYSQEIDSTIVFETEQVAEFKRQTILEEYQIPYSTDKNVKRLLRIGINEGLFLPFIDPSLNQLPFEVSYLRRAGANSALMIGLTGSYGELNGTYVNLRLGYRKYLKSKTNISENTNVNFTGRYVGVEGVIELTALPNSLDIRNQYSVINSALNLPYYDSKTQLSAVYGLQLGGAFDFAVKVGVKYVGKGEVGKDFLLQYNNPTLLPFISTNSLLSLSIGGGKKTLKDDCDFLNCNRQANQLLKLDLSQLIYLDPFMGNINIGGAYERRIGKSNFTSNTYGRIGVSYISRFENKLNYQPETPPENPFGGIGGGFNLPYYNNASTYDFTLNGSIGTELRFYPLKKREILNGKSAQNLNGLYFKVFGELSYNSIPYYQRLAAERFGNAVRQPKPFIFDYGVGLGFQKKVGSKYFYDVFIDYKKTNNQRFSPQDQTSFQFGSRFGIAK